MHKDARFVLDASRVRPQASEVTRLVANADKARRLLGYEPNYGGRPGLQKGIEATVDWFTRPANSAWYCKDGYSI
jgi:dTDP-glucose 4,6-dehydratase